MGRQKSRNLIGLHALTGCDTTSAFFGIGKKTALDLFDKCQALLTGLGRDFDPSAKVLQDAE